MNDFVTIRTFTQYQELLILKSRLEYEGIQTFVPDELTVQINPLYSNAIGGIKLQVRQADVPLVSKILNELGLEHEEHLNNSQNTIEKLIKQQQKIKLFQKINPIVLILISLGVLIGIITTIVFILAKPSTYETLTEATWCVDRIQYNDKFYTPKTDEFIKVVGPGFCEESFFLLDNKRVGLPGFNSRSVSGNWSFSDDSLTIKNADTFDFVYNGIYKVDFLNGKLFLRSSTTVIYCHSTRFNFKFNF